MNKWMKSVIFMIAFLGMCGVIRVDNQCYEITGEGGKLGLSVEMTEGGDAAVCFFGLEGEIKR